MKTRLQAQGRFESSHRIYTKEYKSTLGGSLRIARRLPWAIQRPGPSIFGVANVAIMLPLYEELKGLAGPAQKPARKERAPSRGRLAAIRPRQGSGILDHLPAAEVVRSRMQISRQVHGHPFDLQGGLQGGGPEGVLGCATNLTRTMPTAAVTFTSFEIISRNLDFWFSK